MSITRNLHDALQQFRYTTDVRYLWVDAICINQNDIRERGHQVRLMQSIYKKARNVLVWLGKDEQHATKSGLQSSAELAFEILHVVKDNCRSVRVRMQNGLLPTKSLSRPEREVIQHIQERRIRRMHLRDYTQYKVLEKLFSFAWFWRLWVIQEVVVARAASVHWGSQAIDWAVLGEAASYLKNNYPSSRRHHIFGAYNASYIYEFSIPVKQEKLYPFFTVMTTTWLFNSTDPHDRVFALLGLPNSDNDPDKGNLFLEPDYSMPLDHLYHDVAVRVLEKEKSLRLLNAVQHDPSLPLPTPSWAPQWRSRLMEPLIPFNYIRQDYPAEIDGKWSIFTSDRKVLSLRGFTVANVAQFTDVLPLATEDSLHRPESCNIFKNVEMLLERQKQSLTKTQLKYLCWCLTIGRGFDVWSSQDTHWDLCQDLWMEASKNFAKKTWSRIGVVGDEQEKSSVCCNIHEFMGSGIAGRKLFVTPEGCIGLGPSSLKESDIIVDLFGGCTPYALRKDGDLYYFIGECYMHNYMKREAFDEWEEGERETETFLVA